ncbi:hypothetical protein PVK06_008959 [Gossypium arboreum]|uniref:Uncharacterized protein n=1 Tax=Gossypium arboreum TaxID=29729 RepID=A0ABR0QLA7_GOSAR|nr:hypothetical protein PVK06_008959 [Gossypium arboreum]
MTRAAVEPIELPIGPITRARSKRFKEAISGLVDRIWGEAIAGLVYQSWTSSSCVPCSLLQAEP